MPKDNDSLLNDILNEYSSKPKDTSDNEKSADTEMNAPQNEKLSQVDDAEKTVVAPKSFLENSRAADEIKTSDDVKDEEPTSYIEMDEDEKFIEKAYNESKQPQIRKVDRSNAGNRVMNEKPNPENQPMKKKKKKKKKQRSRLPGVLILTTLIFGISISLSLVIIAYGKDVLGIGKSETTQLFVVEEGATSESISIQLEKEGIIKSPKCFQLFSRLGKKDKTYIAGEHFLRPNMAYETIIKNLTTNQDADKETVAVLFKEGCTLVDAANELELQGVCAADEFLFYFNAGGFNFEFEKELNASADLQFYRMEGFLFPDTYYFYKDMSPEEVCQKIYNNFNQKMTEERLAKMREKNLSLDQLVTFASIVQAEGTDEDSMRKIASVFWNRLNNPDVFPRLQSTPTGKYAENVIKPHMEVYDEATISAYDTDNSRNGLTPGAICNPGIMAIDAVLNPEQTDYYYFYANTDTGVTYFARTLEEHNANGEMIAQQKADAKAAAEAAGEAQ